MVAAWVVSAASAWSAVRPLAIRARSCAGKLSSRSRPSVAKANGIPALRQGGRRGHLFLPLVAAMGQ